MNIQRPALSIGRLQLGVVTVSVGDKDQERDECLTWSMKMSDECGSEALGENNELWCVGEPIIYVSMSE